MNDDLSEFEIPLRRVERDLAELDVDTIRLQREIVERRAEIDKLADQKLGWLRLAGELKKRLGLGLTREEEAALAQGVAPEGERVPVVPRNAFSGMGPSEAALKYLRLLKRGQTHPELVKALKKGNVSTGAKHPDVSFRTAMARHREWFVWIKEKGKLGRWELTEWQNREDPLNVEGTVGETGGPKLALVAQAGLPS